MVQNGTFEVEAGASPDNEMLRVAIRGIHSPERYREMQAIIGGRNTYQQGTDERLLVDFSPHHRGEAQLAVVNLNLLAGVRAELLNDFYGWSPAA